jgi:hypothetical protein
LIDRLYGNAVKRGNVLWMNNRSTHSQVLAWFDRAIARQRTIDGMKDVPVEAGIGLVAEERILEAV